MNKLPADRVRKLQKLLNAHLTLDKKLEPDGAFGSKTRAALKLLQKKAGISTTGEVDSDTADVIARLQRTGKITKDLPKKFVFINGAWVGFTEKEYRAEQRRITNELRRGPLNNMMLNVGALEHEWQLMNDLNAEHWFVSFCIETSHGLQFPPKSICAKARRAYAECDAAVRAGDLAKFHHIYASREKVVNACVDRMRSYRTQMIEGGDQWVSSLEFTKTASFTFVGVFAAPVTGAALGTGVVASAIIGGAAVSATKTAASELGHFAAGTPNWSVGGALKNTVVDAGTGALIGYFAKGAGGKGLVEALSARVFSSLAKETGFKLLSSTALKKAAVFLVTEGAKKALEDAVKDVAKMMKGDKKMTMEKFIDNVAMNFMKGVALGPIGKITGAFATKASSRLSQRDRARIWTVVANELSRQAKGKTLHISEIDKRTQALVEKTIDAQVGKIIDQVVGDVYDNWKGPISPAGFEKALREELIKPARLRLIGGKVAKEVGKKVKVPA